MGVHGEHPAWLMVLRVGHCVCVEQGQWTEGQCPRSCPLLSAP